MWCSSIVTNLGREEKRGNENMNQKEKLISDLLYYLFPGSIARINIDEYDCEIVFIDGDMVILAIDNDIIPWLNIFRSFIRALKDDYDD